MPDPAEPTVLFYGQRCLCLNVAGAAGRYAIVTRGEQQPVGELRWHPHWGRWCFVPAPQTAWDSTCCGEIQLWLLRLARLPR